MKRRKRNQWCSNIKWLNSCPTPPRSLKRVWTLSLLTQSQIKSQNIFLVHSLRLTRSQINFPVLFRSLPFSSLLFPLHFSSLNLSYSVPLSFHSIFLFSTLLNYLNLFHLNEIERYHVLFFLSVWDRQLFHPPLHRTVIIQKFHVSR